MAGVYRSAQRQAQAASTRRRILAAAQRLRGHYGYAPPAEPPLTAGDPPDPDVSS